MHATSTFVFLLRFGMCIDVCLCAQVLRSLCQTWANSSAVRHTPVEQQLYLSRALLLCLGLLSDSELQGLRPGQSCPRYRHTRHSLADHCHPTQYALRFEPPSARIALTLRTTV